MAATKLRRRRRTKIVATIGTIQFSTPEMLGRLFRGGADVFRLNFSHGTHEGHAANIAIIRALEAEMGRPIGILADVQGPKLRVGKLPGGGRVTLQTGQSFRLDLSAVPGDSRRVQLPHPEIMEAAGIGTTAACWTTASCGCGWCASGTTTSSVRSSPGGLLSDRKGVNVPDVVLPIPALTKKDHEDLHLRARSRAWITSACPLCSGRRTWRKRRRHRKRPGLDHDQARKAAGVGKSGWDPGAVRRGDGGARRSGRGAATGGGADGTKAHRPRRKAARASPWWWRHRCWRA